MSDDRYKAGDILNAPPAIQKMFDCHVDKFKIVSYSETDDAYICQPFGDKSWNAAPPFVCQHDTLVAANHAKQSQGVKEMNYKIVVTTDGRDTTATLYDGKVKKNVAKTRCHPNDEFDFGTGAQIAVERLIACSRNAPLPVNGYAICNRSQAGLTAGEIYLIRDGYFVDDDGDIRPTNGKQLMSADDVHDWIFGCLTMLSDKAVQSIRRCD